MFNLLPERRGRLNTAPGLRMASNALSSLASTLDSSSSGSSKRPYNNIIASAIAAHITDDSSTESLPPLGVNLVGGGRCGLSRGVQISDGKELQKQTLEQQNYLKGQRIVLLSRNSPFLVFTALPYSKGKNGRYLLIKFNQPNNFIVEISIFIVELN